MPWFLRSDKRRWTVVAGFALILAWTIAPATLPLYDSIRPDEPYRYVKAPTGSPSTPAPSVGRSVLHATGGHVPAEFVNTAEAGPQASLYVPPGALAVPMAADELILTVSPEAPPSDVPAQGHVVGNVYRVIAVADAQVVSLRSGGEPPALQMRAPSSRQPGPVFEHYDSAGWHRGVRTTRVGIDVYQAQINALGDWALVQLNASGPSTGSSINTGLLAAGTVVLLATGLALGVRVSRRGQSP